MQLLLSYLVETFLLIINQYYCFQKRIVRSRSEVGTSLGSGKGAELREKIIRRAALEFKHGMYGILSTGAQYVPSVLYAFTLCIDSKCVHQSLHCNNFVCVNNQM